jgi:hypothetical protein
MSVSLHFQASLEATKPLLLPLLLPETRAVLVSFGAWLGLYAEQLSSDLSDLEEFAVPLSQHSHVFCVIQERQTEVYTFAKGALQHVTQTLPDGVFSEHLLEFETAVALVKTGVLQGVLLESEPEKPGLAAFFGRSVDE